MNMATGCCEADARFLTSMGQIWIVSATGCKGYHNIIDCGARSLTSEALGPVWTNGCSTEANPVFLYVAHSTRYTARYTDNVAIQWFCHNQYIVRQSHNDTSRYGSRSAWRRATLYIGVSIFCPTVSMTTEDVSLPQEAQRRRERVERTESLM